MIGKSESFSNVSRLWSRDSVRPLGPSHVTSMSDPSGIGNSHTGRFSCSAGFLVPNRLRLGTSARSTVPNRLRLGVSARSTVGCARAFCGVLTRSGALLGESSCGSSHGPNQFRRGSSGTLSLTNSLAHLRGAHPVSAEVQRFETLFDRSRAEEEPPPRGSAVSSEGLRVDRGRATRRVAGPWSGFPGGAGEEGDGAPSPGQIERSRARPPALTARVEKGVLHEQEAFCRRTALGSG